DPALPQCSAAIVTAARHQRLLMKSAPPAVFVHSTTILAASITGPHVSRLCRIKPRISSGLLAIAPASIAPLPARNSRLRTPCDERRAVDAADAAKHAQS